MEKYYCLLITCLLCFQSCLKCLDTPKNDGVPVEVCIYAEIESQKTKTVFCETLHSALWKRVDEIGVCALYNDGSKTNQYFQNFTLFPNNQSEDNPKRALFKGELNDFGQQEYTYYAIFPFSPWQSITNNGNVSLILNARQYPDNNTWDSHSDYLVSKPLTYSSPSVAKNGLSFQFARIFGFFRIKLGETITQSFGNETLETITINGASGDVLSGKFNVHFSHNEIHVTPSLNIEDQSDYITLDYRGKSLLLNDLNSAFFVVNPGQYLNLRITITTNNHIIVFDRNNLSIRCGEITTANLHFKENDTISPTVPILPHNPDTLRILTFGHSYVVDCMRPIEGMLDDAGVKNVVLSNFFIPNCTLHTYLQKSQSSGNTVGGSEKITYYKHHHNGVKNVCSNQSMTVIEALCDEKWDVVVFQTSIEELGFYSKFKNDLIQLQSYVRNICASENKKVPKFAWHMFWAFGPEYYGLDTYYRGDQAVNYYSHVSAAKELMRENDIELVIPTGTAIQSLRQSKYNNYLHYTRDWYHLDVGSGSYVAACTWFEYFLKPCYGISVLGNNYIPSDYNDLPVTSSNKTLFQQIAISACSNPFEITQIDETAQFHSTGSIEQYDSVSGIEW